MKDKRKHIIETSKKLFAEKGFAATGLREIANESGISIGNIYNYFKNKEEIFNHTLDPDDIILSLTDLKAYLNEDIAENLDKMILGIKKIVDEHIDLYRLIFIDLIEFGGYNTNRVVESVIQFCVTIFDQQLKGTDTIGNKLRDLDYTSYIKLFIITILPLFITSNILPSAKIEGQSNEDMVKMLSNVILNGVLV